MRIELTSRAWEARVISIIRRPQCSKNLVVYHHVVRTGASLQDSLSRVNRFSILNDHFNGHV